MSIRPRITFGSPGYLLGLLLLIAGCSSLTTGPGTIPVALIFSNSHCNRMGGPSAQWVATPNLLNNKTNLKWNPETEGCVWLQMGAQPTGGYGLDLMDDHADLQNGVCVVRIRWRQPSPDAFVTQVVTTPCIALKLPKQGIKIVHIQDQEGHIQATIQVPNSR